MQITEFPHLYEWEILSGLPPGREYKQFPNETLNTSIQFLVEITPYQGKSWIGNFGSAGFDFPSSTFFTPRENIIGINSEGAVYFVNVFSPLEFVELPIIPVVKIISIYHVDLLLLVGFTKVAVYDKNGIRWIKKVSQDGIEIKGVTQKKVIGLAWDPSKNRDVDFEIDLLTGIVAGGSS